MIDKFSSSIALEPLVGAIKANWGDQDRMRPLPITEKDGILLITLEDSASLNEGQGVGLRQPLYSLLDTAKEARLAIDLGCIDYISSTGIALLVGVKRRIEAGGGKLALFGLHPDVLELFTVMKLVNLFAIVTDQVQAMELLSLPPSP